VSEPWLGDAERLNVEACIASGWIAAGPFVERFEAIWSRYCGVPYGVSVCNGTAALEVAVAAARLPRGSEVITPSFTIISTVRAILRARCRPVLVDADPRTWCMDVQQLRERVGPRTSAILPVHMYGHPVDMDPVMQLAADHGLVVIEDAAQAHGCEYLSHDPAAPGWRKCGSFGDLACFSFYANKVVTSGEGGMVVTREERYARRCRALRNLGFGAQQRFRHVALGHNYRMSNVQAAIAVAQVERIDEILEQKRRVGSEYHRLLADLPGVAVQGIEAWARPNYWMVGLVLDDAVPFDAAVLRDRLAARGIETRPFFLGMHEQPVLRRRGLFSHDRHPVTERLARRGLYLPSSPRLDSATIGYVVAAVGDALRAA
jgi:perosamine synthetase